MITIASPIWWVELEAWCINNLYGLEGPVSAYQHLVSCAEFAEEGLTATTYVVVSWKTRVVDRAILLLLSSLSWLIVTHCCWQLVNAMFQSVFSTVLGFCKQQYDDHVYGLAINSYPSQIVEVEKMQLQFTTSDWKFLIRPVRRKYSKDMLSFKFRNKVWQRNQWSWSWLKKKMGFTSYLKIQWLTSDQGFWFPKWLMDPANNINKISQCSISNGNDSIFRGRSDKSSDGDVCETGTAVINQGFNEPTKVKSSTPRINLK